MDLMGNPDRVRAERLKARDLKAQYSGYGARAPTRLTTGSSRELPSSPRDYSASGGGGRDSGEISDDWRAGYDRSPTPPHIEARRVVGRDRTSSIGSDKIDFDAGREGYSGRLTRYQEQERREASLSSGSRARRCVDLPRGAF